jgi:hypothetical protein
MATGAPVPISRKNLSSLPDPAARLSSRRSSLEMIHWIISFAFGKPLLTPNCARSAYFTCPLARDDIPLAMAAGERDPHVTH